MNCKRIFASVSIAAAVAVSAGTALVAAGAHDNNKTHDGMGEMNRGGGMMDGMMGNMRGKGGMMGMMDSCPMMRGNDNGEGDTDRPNSQWREKELYPGKKGG